MAVNPVFQRLSLLTGEEALIGLHSSSAIVFGVGGVGSWCAEGLVRSGIGKITLVDSDVVCITNVNRQLQATTKNVGKSKVEQLKERLSAISPKCHITAIQAVYSKETRDQFGIEEVDYVIDAIDSLTHKLDLIVHAFEAGATLFSAMGAAAKLDPTRFEVADIWDTKVCPLSRLVRKGLRERGFKDHFQVVYSQELVPPAESTNVACGTHSCMCPDFAPAEGEPEAKEWCSSKKVINGSAVHVTASAGMILCGLVVQDMTAKVQAAKASATGKIPATK